MLVNFVKLSKKLWTQEVYYLLVLEFNFSSFLLLNFALSFSTFFDSNYIFMTN